ncbi:4-hydroxy-3-methylbut-2-enyl diphosphate reductase [bacterium]|nr:4-hydroxy-3-methylbut-2-enyl diphosphate reductase [bacterium]
MEVYLIKPMGYCYGVIRAIKLAQEVKEKYPHKNVYVWGLLVHNRLVVASLEKQGIHTIDLTKTEPLVRLKELSKEDIVIFSAHGHLKKHEEYLIKQGIKFFDATCFKVQQNMDLIQKEEEVIYIGKKGHPETEAALAVNPTAKFYDLDQDFNYQAIKREDPLVVNQTTLSFLELQTIHQKIKEHLPKARISDEICDATKLRQVEIQKLDSSYQAVIIVGSKESSNTTKLYQLAKKCHPEKTIYQVENLEDLLNYPLNLKKVALGSGTSTPPKTILEIKGYLERRAQNGE